MPYLDVGTIVLITVYFFSSVTGIVVTLVQRVSTIIRAQREGFVAEATWAWVEPLSLTLFIIFSFQFQFFVGAVIWNLGFATVTIRGAFQLLLKTVKECEFKSLEDVKLLGRIFPRLLRIARKVSSVSLSLVHSPSRSLRSSSFHF